MAAAEVDERNDASLLDGLTGADEIAGSPGRTQGDASFWVVLPWVLATAAIIIAAFTTFQWLSFRTDEASRNEIALLAREGVTTLMTWDALTTLDDARARLAEISTNEFNDDVDGFFSGPAGDEIRANQTSSVGEVSDVFVHEIDGDLASVFIVFRRETTSATRIQPLVAFEATQVFLERVDGRWLIQDIVNVGLTLDSDPGISTSPEPDPASTEPAAEPAE